MYSRRYDGQLLTFEASGGLINSSLVMQDRETNSYWAIMKGEAIAGLKKGTELAELPLGKKMKWKRWKRKHPDTLVLSVNGTEDGQWVDISSGCRFDPDEEVFDGDTESCPKAFKGFDTFWYNWSLNNPSTELLM